MKHVVVAAVIAAAASAAATAATAEAPPWKVFARGTDTSDYYASASANADAPRSQALAVRAVSSNGLSVKVSFSLLCFGEASVPSGKVLVASVAVSKKCSLAGYGSQDGGGTVRVELLRR